MKKIFSSLRITGLAISGLLMMGVLFSACDKDDDDNDVEIKASGLMATNLSPDLAAGIFLSGNSLTPSPLYYNNYTGGYMAIYSGTRTVQTFDYANTVSPVAANNFGFMDDKYYSLFVLGTEGNYMNKIVEDKFDDLSAGSGMAYIRYVNAIPDSTNTMVDISASGESMNNSAKYGMVSEFNDVQSGDVTIHITNGTMVDVSRTITVEERGVYTILLTGMPDASDADAVQIKYIKNGMLDEDAEKMESNNFSVIN